MNEKDRPKHPAFAHLERLGPDGIPRAYSVDEQWEHIAHWFAFLESGDADDISAVDGLNKSWEALEGIYLFEGKPFLERGEALRTISHSPLEALFYFIGGGFYPPPELLLALLDVWLTYGGSRGDTSLERAFFGPEKKGIGNYASRANSRFSRQMMRREFADLLLEGRSRTEAAEKMSEERGGKPDVESILRMLRGFNGWGRKSGSTPEK